MKNLRYHLFLFLTLVSTSLIAQEGCEIIVRMQGYNYDTLWFGRSIGKRAAPEFFAVKEADGSFILKNEKYMPPDMYAIIFKRALNAPFQFISCWLTEGERRFSFQTDINQIRNNTSVVGSRENELLYPYLNQYFALAEQIDSLTDNWKETQDKAAFEAKVKAEEALHDFQSAFISQNPGTLSAELAAQTLFMVPPPANEKTLDWQQEAIARFQWQKQHFFDNMKLADDMFLHRPLWVHRTDFYATKLAPPQPDSMILLLENVFNQLKPNTTNYQYYFRYMMNSLGNMSRYRTDEVFVHFVRKYITTGKSDWMAESDLEKFKIDASRMEPLFVGKKAPNIKLFDKANNPVSLYDINAPYTLLVFWLYDCSHCAKELPVVKKIYEQFKSKGLTVMSVCGKNGNDALPHCWEFAERMQMPPEWHILADPLQLSRFASLFNIRTYPRLFLLDANKKIIFKQVGEASETTLTRAFNAAVK